MFGTVIWLCVFLCKTAIGLDQWGTVKPLNITEIMIRNEVIPQIIPECFPVFCNVFYTTRNFSINYRQSYRTTELKKVPIIKWNCDSNKLYTLIFSNLDHANDTHVWTYQIHWWLLVNIANCDVQKGEEIFPYKSPKMWPEYGIYKQLFLIYEQAQQITVELAKNTVINDTTVRHNFTIQQFTNQYKFGCPIAGNFFRLGVPIIPLTTIPIFNRNTSIEKFHEANADKAEELYCWRYTVENRVDFVKNCDSVHSRNAGYWREGRLKKKRWQICSLEFLN